MILSKRLSFLSLPCDLPRVPILKLIRGRMVCFMVWLANCYFAHDSPPCWHSAMRRPAQPLSINLLISPFKSTNLSGQVSGTSGASKTQSGLNVNHFRQRCMKARPDTNYFPVLFKSPLFYLLEVARPRRRF